MILNVLQSVMYGIEGCGAPAGSSSGTTGAGCDSANLLTLLLPLLMVVVLLVVMIIPQRRRDRKVKDMLGALKQGDRVRTIGGIYGTISSIKDDVIILSVGPDKVKLVFARGAISQVEDAGVENTMSEEIKD